jgi:MFS transporter, ENTS family, enterobactin (siderophore) exporter
MTTPHATARIAARFVAAAGLAALVTLTVRAVDTTGRSTAGQVWDGDYADPRGLASWLAAALSEPQYYVVGTAGCGLLLGGLLAHLAQRRSRRWAGFVQACGTGGWPWVVGSALASLLVGALLWGWTLRYGAWQPLFVPLVAVAPAMVVLYGPDPRVCLTAAVSGALLTPPASILAVSYLCTPWHLPPVVGATTGMWTGGLAAFRLCRYLPWMPEPGAWRKDAAVPPPAPPSSWLWLPRRALADFSEAQFFGNEWASAAMLLGAAVAYLASPASLVYGSGLFPAVLAGQAVTALAGVLLWRRRWRALGFYPTFVPVVSVAPAAVLACGGTAASVLLGALAGAVVAPPLAAAISRRLPSHVHPFVGNVASMSVSTAVIVPLLHSVPGVSA